MIDPNTGQSMVNNPLAQALMSGHQGGGAMGFLSQLLQVYAQQKMPDWRNQQTQADSIGAGLSSDLSQQYPGMASFGAGGGVY